MAAQLRYLLKLISLLIIPSQLQLSL